MTVFVHRSDEEKRRHVGAGATSFTKPWLREIHLTQAGWPHPVLRHELVHAVAAALDPGPLGVPARAGVLVAAGLVEGLAVALEVPRGSWTVHEWSAALGDLGMAPDVAGQLGPAGFWTTAPARAYTAAGSFIAFLLDRHGGAAVARLYRTGDFEAAFGRPLRPLVAEWQAFLAALPRPPGLAAAARARFSPPGPLRRPLRARGGGAGGAGLGRGRPRPGRGGLRRAAARLGPHRPGRTAEERRRPAGAERRVRRGRGRLPARRRARPARTTRPSRRRWPSARADLAWRRDQPAEAAAGWQAALDAGGERQDRRLLEAKLAALADPDLAGALRPWLLGQADPAAALAGLERLDRPLPAYLAARAHLSRGESRRPSPSCAAPRPARFPTCSGGRPAPCWPRRAASPARPPRERGSWRRWRRGRTEAPSGLASRPACGGAPSRRGGATRSARERSARHRRLGHDAELAALGLVLGQLVELQVPVDLLGLGGDLRVEGLEVLGRRGELAHAGGHRAQLGGAEVDLGARSPSGRRSSGSRSRRPSPRPAPGPGCPCRASSRRSRCGPRWRCRW